jgi:hypothetical protein
VAEEAVAAMAGATRVSRFQSGPSIALEDRQDRRETHFPAGLALLLSGAGPGRIGSRRVAGGFRVTDLLLQRAIRLELDR